MTTEKLIETAVCQWCGKTFRVTGKPRIGQGEYCNARCVDKMIHDFNKGGKGKPK